MKYLILSLLFLSACQGKSNYSGETVSDEVIGSQINCSDFIQSAKEKGQLTAIKKEVAEEGIHRAQGLVYHLTSECVEEIAGAM